MIFVCVDEGLQKTWDGGLSASDIFAQSFKGLVWLLSPTIPTILTRRCSLPLRAFRWKKRMLSQKERAESEVLAWRRALYSKEKNAVIEKAHGKELLS